MPVFFTVVTIFDGSIFTRFGWFRAFAGDVTVGAAVVAHGAVRTVARYVTLVKKVGGGEGRREDNIEFGTKSRSCFRVRMRHLIFVIQLHLTQTYHIDQ